MKAPHVTQAADNVYLVGGTVVNWIVLTDADAVTLIDVGYPRDLPLVEESLRGLGYRLEQVAAVLLTHAHVDHMGAVPELLRRHAVPVFTSSREVRHARREYLESAGPREVTANLWRRGTPMWAVRVIRAGALTHVSVPGAEPFPQDGPLDLPGRPVPVPTPGHTSGHCCYHLPESGVIVTGDALVTAHPTVWTRGPQLLLPFFSRDQAATLASLDELERLDADVVLPGHGPLHRGTIRAAATLARERATSRRR